MAIASLEELVVAYRKAKVDLYYSSDPRLVDLVEYEEHLGENLASLRERLNGRSEDWVDDPAYLGDYTLAPKAIRLDSGSSGAVSGLPGQGRTETVWSEPSTAWSETVRRSSPAPLAEFRVMSRCSIDMHVLSTHWMLTVGSRMEAVLPQESMGSRLRRTRAGEINPNASGSFARYYVPFSQWRDRGLDAMNSALERGRSVAALTADISSFYHKLGPSFLLDQSYLHEVLGLELSVGELRLNRLFVGGLAGWAAMAAQRGRWTAGGIPVGLPASAVVANLALIELDRLMKEEIKPIYYGRYVDDIILVLDDDPRLITQDDVWDWIARRSRGLLERDSVGGHTAGARPIRFAPSYLHDSELLFENGKNKTFHLAGEGGRMLVSSIKSAIDDRASEWRSFTPISDDPVGVSLNLAMAIRHDGEQAATLRDADRVATRKSAFALQLRDFEAYERDVDLDSWANLRHAFFDAVCRNVLVLPHFFELAPYLPRLIKLAAACGDSTALRDICRALAEVYSQTRSTCRASVKAYAEPDSRRDEVFERWARQLISDVLENVASGLSEKIEAAQLEYIVAPLHALQQPLPPALKVKALGSLHRRLFARDLAHVPYRFAVLNRATVPTRSVRELSAPAAEIEGVVPLSSEVVEGLDLLLGTLRAIPRTAGRHPQGPVRGSENAGLVFSTRPPNAWELHLAMRGQGDAEGGVAAPGVIRSVLTAVRGYAGGDDLLVTPSSESCPATLHVGTSSTRGKVRFALAVVGTEEDAWKGAAIGRQKLSRLRYEALKGVMREATSRPGTPRYLVLPELALPSRWFVPFAARLQRDGVNLVAGIEYLAGEPGTVRNQVWAALRSEGSGFRGHVVYAQDKQRPAPAEERRLHDIDQLTLDPEVKWSRPPIIAHGDFRFAILICSELTNINYRAALRGQVDALVVPEWNRDLHTFESLVESAALDLHAYVVQVNHRSFGDSRIRSPRRKEWERDVVQLKGGAHDYVVIDEIDFRALREHQSSDQCFDCDFKPVPDGFEIAADRRLVPKCTSERSRHCE